MSRFDDDQLKAFLQKNQPVPPPAKHSELEKIQVRLGLVEPKRRIAPAWLAASGAIAAGLLGVWMTVSSPLSTEVAVDRAVNLETATAMEEDELLDEELPTLDIGEDYLELVAAN